MKRVVLMVVLLTAVSLVTRVETTIAKTSVSSVLEEAAERGAEETVGFDSKVEEVLQEVAPVKESEKEQEEAKVKKKKRKIKRTPILQSSNYAMYDRLSWGNTLFINLGNSYYFDTTEADGVIASGIEVVTQPPLSSCSYQAPYVYCSTVKPFGGKFRIKVNYPDRDSAWMDFVVNAIDGVEMQFTMLQSMTPARFVDGSYRIHGNLSVVSNPVYYGDFWASGLDNAFKKEGLFQQVSVHDKNLGTETFVPLAESQDASEYCEVGITSKISVIVRPNSQDTFLQGAQCYVSKKKLVKSFTYKPGMQSFEIEWKKPGKCKVVILYGKTTLKYKFKIVNREKQEPWPTGVW